MAGIVFKKSWTDKVFWWNKIHIAEPGIWQQTFQIMSNMEDTEFN